MLVSLHINGSCYVTDMRLLSDYVIKSFRRYTIQYSLTITLCMPRGFGRKTYVIINSAILERAYPDIYVRISSKYVFGALHLTSYVSI